MISSVRHAICRRSRDCWLILVVGVRKSSIISNGEFSIRSVFGLDRWRSVQNMCRAFCQRQEYVWSCEQAEAAIQSATNCLMRSVSHNGRHWGHLQGAAALYNAMFNQPASNNRMEARRLKTIIATFQQDHGLTQDMSVMLMRTVSRPD